MNANIHIVAIPNTGHNIRRESFPEYVSAVLTFLTKL